MTRTYGSGTMRERRPGSWQLRVYVGPDPVTGKPRQVSRTFRGGKRAAAVALADLVSKHGAGRGDVEMTATFGTLLDAWIDQGVAAGRAPTTLETYRRHVEHRIRPALGDVRLPDLTTHRLDAYLRTLDGELAPKTIALERSILRAACELGVRWAWLARNPVAGTLVRKTHEPERRALSREAVSGLAGHCMADDRVLGAAVAFAALTGARRGEVLGLRWSDIDLEAQVATIRQNVTPAPGGIHVGPPKNGKPRSIAIPQAAGLLVALRAYWSTLGPEPASSCYVFGAGDGSRPSRPKALTEFFAKHAKAAGVTARLHDLRHFAVSRAVGAGWDVTTASAYFGHTPQVMLGTYSHGSPETAHELAAGLTTEREAP